jgi:hypothetical protein
MNGQAGEAGLHGLLEIKIPCVSCLAVHGEDGPDPELAEEIQVLNRVLLVFLEYGKDKGRPDRMIRRTEVGR